MSYFSITYKCNCFIHYLLCFKRKGCYLLLWDILLWICLAMVSSPHCGSKTVQFTRNCEVCLDDLNNVCSILWRWKSNTDHQSLLEQKKTPHKILQCLRKKRAVVDTHYINLAASWIIFFLIQPIKTHNIFLKHTYIYVVTILFVCLHSVRFCHCLSVRSLAVSFCVSSL